MLRTLGAIAGGASLEGCFKTEVYVSRLSLYSMVLLVGVGSALAACGSDDDTSGGTAGSGGKASAGSSGKSGSAGKAGGGSGNAGEAGEAGAGGAASTLYERLGGHDGIKAAIGAIVTAELADDDIASYFAPNLQVASHEPGAPDIIDCFTALLGKAAGGEEEYPYTTDNGYTCRSMADAHADLHIGGGTFDNFVSIAAGVLKEAGVADADIEVVGGVLVGTKGVIVDPDAPENGPCVSPACEVPGAGGAGGEGGSN